MIKIVCPECSVANDPTEDKSCYLEFNLTEKAMYFKCPSCKKTSTVKLYKEDKPLPRFGRT